MLGFHLFYAEAKAKSWSIALLLHIVGFIAIWRAWF